MKNGTATVAMIAGLASSTGAWAAAPPLLKSPDGRIEVQVKAGERLQYDVRLDGKPVLQDAALSLDVDGTALGANPKVKGAKTRPVDSVVEPPVRQKSEKIRDHFNELRLELQGGYAVVFRAYDEGVAYRFETALPQKEVKVRGEEARFRFVDAKQVYYAKEEEPIPLFSHQERHYLPVPLATLSARNLATLPAIVERSDGVKVAIAESNVEEYPGLWLRGNGDQSLSATFPPYPLEEKLERDRDLKVVKAADYIAVTRGARTYPWRILGIARTDADLLTNRMVYLLASPSRVADTSWIKPGKVAWDWWNANNVYGVDFKSGVNTATYKYYIDFAAKYGIDYVILDEGWYVLGDVLKVSPGMDMEDLTAYAKQKGVGLILWVVWNTFDAKFDAAFAQFETWGIRGIKVDFMQRDDQKLIEYYHRVCREAAKHHMLVDFHGCQRPALMTRTWPNLISTEGVRGLEWVKWSDAPHPEHNVTLPFTRMFLGPMDYTPGAMRNASQKSFVKVFEQPMSLGTRCHQLAMYVVFESPLQMLADSPSQYLREPEAMEFLSAVPTVWDETKVLDAHIADDVVIARRRGREWYVGAMTDWTARDVEVDLSFLPEGTFQVDAYQDGINAERWGSDYKRTKSKADRTSKLKVHLAEGGGWAARLTPAP
jgi:alpha-glucosidase